MLLKPPPHSPQLSEQLSAEQQPPLPQALTLGDLLYRVDKALGQARFASSAETWLSHARRAARQQSDLRSESLAVGTLGALAELAGQWPSVLERSRIATVLAERAGAYDLLYRWQWQSARALEALGNEPGAAAAYEQALATLSQIRGELSSGVFGSFERELAPLFFDAAKLLLRQADQAPDRTQRRTALLAVRDVIENLRTAEVRNYFQDDCVLAENRDVDLRALAGDAAVIYPILFEDRLEVLVSIGDELFQHRAAVRRGELRRRVIEFRRALSGGQVERYKAPARELFSWLIEPALPALTAAGVHTLVIVPDGPLRSVPLGALWTGQRHLIEDFAIAVSVGISLADPTPLNTEQLRVLASGLSVAAGGLEALPGVSQELRQIDALYPGKTLLNTDFRVDPLLRELSVGPYSVVHIATHGKFAADYRNSFLQAYDGRVTLDDLEMSVARRRYRNAPLELLVLSACETAVGDDRAALGLAGIALKAGARSAVATLWSVSDAATAALVGEFYRQLSDPAKSKAQALQAAQIALIESDSYAHPRAWSPYLMLGNWL